MINLSLQPKRGEKNIVGKSNQNQLIEAKSKNHKKYDNIFNLNNLL